MRVSFLLMLLALPSLAAATPLSATASPAQVVLGVDKVVVVQVRVPPGTRRLRAAASSGSLMPLPATARGVYAYRWVPPDIRYPLLAVLAFWEDVPEGPPEVTTVNIPLLGRTSLDVTTEPGAEVVVVLGETRFGPVRANRKGHAQVPLEVPPGMKQARVLANFRGQQTDRVTRLATPPERPLLALFSPSVLPVDSGGWLLVLGDEPVSEPALKLALRGGSVVETEQARPGVFRVRPEPGVSAVTVEAHWKDGSGASRLTVPVVAPIVASAVVMEPEKKEPEAPPAPPLPPPAPDWVKNLSLHVLAGGFAAGGDNAGPLLALGAGYQLPVLHPWMEGRQVTAELEVGLRSSATRPTVQPLGPMDSRLMAVPVLLSVRGLVLERGPLSLHGRVGAGVLPFHHRTTSDFFLLPLEERRLGFMGFLSAQGAWRFGAWSALVELRGSYGAARTNVLDAQLGGLSASVGVRYAL